MWILERPVVRIDAESPGLEKEALCLRALSLSRRDVPDPGPSEDISIPLLEAAGVRSWRTFTKGVKLCEVEEDGAEFGFLPYKTVGSAFEPLNDQRLTMPATDGGPEGFATHLEMCLSTAH
jgi:hypothetical protein